MAQTLTLGIDLASKSDSTAACAIDWEPGGRRVVPLEELCDSSTLDDATLIALIQADGVRRVAIDAPFGWPLDFVDAISSWRDRQAWPVPLGDPESLQESLVLRKTDLEVVRATKVPLHPRTVARRGKWPLRVSADRIGVVAMRCARLLAEVGQLEGDPIDRAGSGKILEVYPDAAIREWGLWREEWDQPKQLSYKGRTQAAQDRREDLITDLAQRAGPWLADDDKVIEDCIKSDDDLDALISAILARAVDQGESQPVLDSERAELEGWIHLPNPGSLEALLAR